MNEKCSGRSIFIALLATLAFAGGAQGLAPAPAAALQTEKCTDMGIFGNVCTYVDDGQGQGGGDGGASGGKSGGGHAVFNPAAGLDDDPDDYGAHGDGIHYGPPLAPDPAAQLQHNMGTCGLIPGKLRSAQYDLQGARQRSDNDSPEVTEGKKIATQRLKSLVARLKERWNSHHCDDIGP